MSGGNALGAFHGGAYQALVDAGAEPDWIVGSSIGAVTALLVAGNPPGRRVERLRRFWQLASSSHGRDLVPDRAAALASVASVRLFGRGGLFVPVVPRLSREMPYGAPALYSLEPLAATLAGLVDLERVNRAEPRVTMLATGLLSGEARLFDNTRQALRIEHALASAALPVDFAPIVVDGEPLCDGGVSANLPLAAALVPSPAEDAVCIAVDLFCGRGELPLALDDMVGRTTDLMFASQSARQVETARLAHAAAPSPGNLVLAHVVHDGTGEHVGPKTFDFSPEAVATRWAAGHRAMREMLARLPPRPPKGFTYLSSEAR